jgi:hypothetical protein
MVPPVADLAAIKLLVDDDACLFGTINDRDPVVNGVSMVWATELLELLILCGEGPTAEMAVLASWPALVVETNETVSSLPLSNIRPPCGGGGESTTAGTVEVV